MTTFQEFIETLARKQNAPERQRRREEWVAAVGRLRAQVQAWLKESDPKGLLEVIPYEDEKWDPTLGLCKLPVLQIGIGDATVDMVPRGRHSIGMVEVRGEAPRRAEGRVDMTAGVRAHILYRVLEDGRECWYALNERFEAAPLDRARLEEILQDLLS